MRLGYGAVRGRARVWRRLWPDWWDCCLLVLGGGVYVLCFVPVVWVVVGVGGGGLVLGGCASGCGARFRRLGCVGGVLVGCCVARAARKVIN